MKKRRWFSALLAGVMAVTMGTVRLGAQEVAPAAAGQPLVNENPETFCNPVNLSYSYQYGLNRGTGGFRMLADPQPIYYQGEYWMFPTHATGYYHSSNLVDWEFVYSNTQQVNNYAPGVFEHDGYLYISRHSRGNLYRTRTPQQGDSWEYVRGTHCQDPFYYSDADTGRLFEIHGCVGINNSDKNKKPPIYIMELDTSSPTLEPLPVDTSVPGADPNIGYPVFYMNRDQHGYEVPGQYNEDYNGGSRSWLEGGGMLKYKGRYYIYYSGPATECASYCEGCYVSDDPLGSYEWCDSSPFAYKATGFTVGAGHGHSIVEQASGRLWKFGSVSIASNDSWERRLNLYPLEFDQYNRPVTDLSAADYPMYVPGNPKGSYGQQGPDWNLVSYGITATASSTHDAAVTSLGAGQSGSFQISPDKAFDENIRTWWSAKTGEAGEWLMGDMGKICTVNAVQLNFADQDAATNNSLPDDLKGLSSIREYTGCYRYKIEYSLDGQEWQILADKSNFQVQPFQGQDTSHDYYELVTGVPMRYIRVTNQGDVPAHGKFAISGLRLFGNGNGEKPQAPASFTVSRIAGADGRSAQVSWEPVPGAEGYIIRYGTKEDSLNIHHQAIGETSIRINNLSTNRNYYFRIDAYNDSGRSIGTEVKMLPGSYGEVAYEEVSITVGKGEFPELPSQVEAYVASGNRPMEVRWDKMEDSSLLAQEGTFSLLGIVKETGDAVYAKIQVSDIIGVQTVTRGIAKGQQPNLPQYVDVYYSNGEIVSRKVAWNLSGVDFGTEGMVEVTGCVGSATAKARIRVENSNAPVAQYGDYKVTSIQVDGKEALPQFQPETNTLVWEAANGEITAQATNNASITILKPINGVAKLIFLPENGNQSKRQEYTVTFQEKPDPEKPDPEKPDPEKPTPEKPDPEKPLAKVSGLKATPSQSSVTLAWKRVPGASGYLVFCRKPGAKQFRQVADVKKTSYRQKKLSSASPYSYRVCAYKKDGKKLKKGKFSATIKILTKPAKPLSVKIKRTSKVTKNTTALLTFQKVKGASAYQIYKYHKGKKKYHPAYRVRNGKLYQYHAKTKKYHSSGKVKMKNGKISCTLKSLNLKKEKAQSYRIKAIVSKNGYKNQASAYSKKVTVK